MEFFNLPALRVNGVRVSGAVMFGGMIWAFYLRVIVPLLGVFYGTSLMADEVEDSTLTYLFTRPIPRGAVLIGKYLAYLACTGLIVLPSVMLVFFLVMPLGGGGLRAIARGFPDLLKDLGLLGLGLAVYGAVFAFIGAQLKRPLLVGLFFIVGWEIVVLSLPGYLKRFTVAYYLQSLVPHAMPQDNIVSALQSFFQESSRPLAACGPRGDTGGVPGACGTGRRGARVRAGTVRAGGSRARPPKPWRRRNPPPDATYTAVRAK